VLRLASAFAKRFATKMGRTVVPLTAGCAERLKGYSWPSNVRELQNVTERAVITATDVRLNLDLALPEATAEISTSNRTCEPSPGIIHTAKEMEKLEYENIIRALEATKWKISGENGAAKLRGINASTLSSRMRALKIQKPTSRRP
jgi:transcriptional regulator with GAF, ATPase, and Fis domain